MCIYIYIKTYIHMSTYCVYIYIYRHPSTSLDISLHLSLSLYISTSFHIYLSFYLHTAFWDIKNYIYIHLHLCTSIYFSIYLLYLQYYILRLHKSKSWSSFWGHRCFAPLGGQPWNQGTILEPVGCTMAWRCTIRGTPQD